jgi:hypothetical protein
MLRILNCINNKNISVMNEEKELMESLVRNGIKSKNIISFLKLKEEAEKLGFEFSEYDGMDGEFLVTFAIKE